MAGLNMRAAMKAPKKAAKEIAEIRVAPASNGGQTAYHHHTSMDHPDEGPHIFPAHGEKVPVMEGHLFHHMAKHLGIPHEVMAKGEAEPAEEMEEETSEAE
jgi:hypothetical protein